MCSAPALGATIQMDLLVITWNYPPRRGGIENLLENLCGGLREKHRVFIVTSFSSVPYPAEPDTFRAPLAGLIPFAFYALWRGALVLACNRKIRIVFGGSALVTPLVLLLGRLSGRQAVVLTHGLDVIHRKFFYQLLCVCCLKFCDHVVANSNHTAALARSKAVAQKRITVIPPGVRPERFCNPTDVVAIRRRWNIEGNKIILFVGRLAKRKGIKEFIESSLIDIVRKVPETVFLIVGDNPAESLAHRDDVVGEINKAISRLGLVEHVRMLGALDDDDVIQLYHACDVVVLPVLDTKDDVEGFGIVALEAAAAGKPVIATRVGGIPDAIQDGKNGILVESGNYQVMSEALVRLLVDPIAHIGMAQSGRLWTRNRFAWTEIAKKYEWMFETTLGAKAKLRSRSAE